MRVLLTGASGFIGGYVLDALNAQDIETVTIGRTRNPNAKEFIESDLLTEQDFPSLLKKADATHLIHLAWYVEHGKFWDSLINLQWIEASVRLAKAFLDSGGKKIIGIGSGTEYKHTFFAREGGTKQSSNLYGASKDATRRLIASFCPEQNLIWGRIFIPFGSGENENRLIPSLIKVFKGEKLPFETSGAKHLDFLHASDVAKGIITLLLVPAFGEYNICSGKTIRIKEIIKRIARSLNADPKPMLHLMKEEPNISEYYCGSNVLLKKLGWEPNLEDNIITRGTNEG